MWVMRKVKSHLKPFEGGADGFCGVDFSFVGNCGHLGQSEF